MADETTSTTNDQPQDKSRRRGARKAAGTGTTMPVKIAIPEETYEADAREMYWIGLTEECPLDHADVSLGAPSDGTIESFREYRAKFDGLKPCITLHKRKRQFEERQGVPREVETSGGFEMITDVELQLFYEALGRLGVNVEHREEDGELVRAHPPRRIRVGDQPLAQWVFVEKVENPEKPRRIVYGVDVPTPLQIETA